MMDKEQEASGVSGEEKETQSQKPSSPSSTAPAVSQKEIREIFRREAQSLVTSELDKAVGGIRKWRTQVDETQKQFDKITQQLVEAGVLDKDADLSAVKRAVANEALMSIPELSEPEVREAVAEELSTEAPAKVPRERTIENDPVWFTANLVAEKYGLADGDPELAELITDQGPVPYIESVVVAAKKKSARLAQSGEVDLENLVPTDMGTGKVSKKNPLEDKNDPDELLEMGLY